MFIIQYCFFVYVGRTKYHRCAKKIRPGEKEILKERQTSKQNVVTIFSSYLFFTHRIAWHGNLEIHITHIFIWFASCVEVMCYRSRFYCHYPMKNLSLISFRYHQLGYINEGHRKILILLASGGQLWFVDFLWHFFTCFS